MIAIASIPSAVTCAEVAQETAIKGIITGLLLTQVSAVGWGERSCFSGEKKSMRCLVCFMLGLALVSFAGVGWGDCVEGDCVNGKGRHIYSNGDVYEGDFKLYVPDGKGKTSYANGDVYVGDYKVGRRAGKGKFTWANGDVYEGDWKASQRNGSGKFTYANGQVLVGVFQDDVWLGTAASVEREKKRRLTEQEQARLAQAQARKVEAQKRIAKAKAKAKFQKIFNACLLDKSSGVDMQVKSIEAAVKATCEAIAKDPSWLESLQYD